MTTGLHARHKAALIVGCATIMTAGCIPISFMHEGAPGGSYSSREYPDPTLSVPYSPYTSRYYNPYSAAPYYPGAYYASPYYPGVYANPYYPGSYYSYAPDGFYPPRYVPVPVYVPRPHDGQGNGHHGHDDDNVPPPRVVREPPRGSRGDVRQPVPAPKAPVGRVYSSDNIRNDTGRGVPAPKAPLGRDPDRKP